MFHCFELYMDFKDNSVTHQWDYSLTYTKQITPQRKWLSVILVSRMELLLFLLILPQVY